MGVLDKAHMMASLAQLNSARSGKDVTNWFNSNPWIYATISQIIHTISEKFEIISCDKSVSDNDITFTIHSADSNKIYSGIKNLVKANIAMVSKFKVKFSVDVVSDTDIDVVLSVIPGKTDSFLNLLNTIEEGVKNV